MAPLSISEPEEYENFDLLIERSGRGFRASVFGAPGGDGQSAFRPPYAKDELQEILARLATSQRDLGPATPPRETIEAIGTRLFESLFQGEVGLLWTSSRAKVEAHPGKGLRLRLRFRDAPGLEAWPWELLFDPSRRRFLALSVRTPVVRYLDLPIGSLPLLAKPPLKMLVAVARPAGYSALDADSELARLHQALKGLIDRGWLVLERLENVTLERLQERFLKPVHILHFVGHGRFDPKERNGSLIFEDGAGGARIVPGGTLGAVLATQKVPRLVVLNSCEGALTAKDDPFAGVAQALVGCGVPAVIAMRSRISDSAAITFAEHFYGALGRNLPVDGALADARRALFARPENLAWIAPVLYTRSPDCRLFQFPRPPRQIWKRISISGAALLAAAGLAGSVQDYRAHPSSFYALMNPRECPSPPGLSMAFVKIEPGAFLMGKEPGHAVTLTRPFCLGRFEMPWGQWRRIMKRSARRKQADDDFPVSNINWNQAQEFLNELNRLEPGARYRLPTEAEWEYASRAGTETHYSFGDDPNDLSKYANCKNETGSDGFEKIARVGQFRKNPWGLFDMYGNVAEWVDDWYAPLPDGPMADPRGPALGTEKIRRGGSFHMSRDCGSDFRAGSKPERRNEDTGFRVVRDLESPSPTKQGPPRPRSGTPRPQ
jgi:formylglycine-generating enzyme required for sulfatase activity